MQGPLPGTAVRGLQQMAGGGISENQRGRNKQDSGYTGTSDGHTISSLHTKLQSRWEKGSAWFVQEVTETGGRMPGRGKVMSGDQEGGLGWRLGPEAT